MSGVWISQVAIHIELCYTVTMGIKEVHHKDHTDIFITPPIFKKCSECGFGAPEISEFNGRCDECRDDSKYDDGEE